MPAIQVTDGIQQTRERFPLLPPKQRLNIEPKAHGPSLCGNLSEDRRNDTPGKFKRCRQDRRYKGDLHIPGRGRFDQYLVRGMAKMKCTDNTHFVSLTFPFIRKPAIQVIAQKRAEEGHSINEVYSTRLISPDLFKMEGRN